MLVYRGPISHLEYNGFTYNGNNGYFKSNIDSNGIFHLLTIQFEHFRPIGCKYSDTIRCSECMYDKQCRKANIVTHTSDDGKTSWKEVKWVFKFPDVVEGVITEDSNPDDYLMSLIQDYTKETNDDD